MNSKDVFYGCHVLLRFVGCDASYHHVERLGVRGSGAAQRHHADLVDGLHAREPAKWPSVQESPEAAGQSTGEVDDRIADTGDSIRL